MKKTSLLCRALLVSAAAGAVISVHRLKKEAVSENQFMLPAPEDLGGLFFPCYDSETDYDHLYLCWSDVPSAYRYQIRICESVMKYFDVWTDGPDAHIYLSAEEYPRIANCAHSAFAVRAVDSNDIPGSWSRPCAVIRQLKTSDFDDDSDDPDEDED